MTLNLRFIHLCKFTVFNSIKRLSLPTQFISRLFIGMLLILPTYVYCAPETKVDVISHSSPRFLLTFNEAPRADDLVLDALRVMQRSTADIDWLSSALFEISHPYDKKQQVLTAVSIQEQLAAEHHKTQWRQLYEQLNKRSFSKRIFTPLEPDVTRITADQNPKLSGQWLLILPPLPTKVAVLGNVKLSDQITWQPRTDARYYLDKLGLVDKNTSQVWVIQPDGQASLHNIAYWNYQFQNIAPGATIYVPLPVIKNTLSSQLSDVNHAVVDLLRNQQP